MPPKIGKLLSVSQPPQYTQHTMTFDTTDEFLASVADQDWSGEEEFSSTQDGDSDPLAAQVFEDQWDSLRKKIHKRRLKETAADVFGDSASKGGVYRWGVAVASGQAPNEVQQVLSRLACDRKVSAKRIAEAELSQASRLLGETLSGGQTTVLDSAEAVMWAAALPRLIEYLDANDWWRLLGALQEYRDACLRRNSATPHYLIGGGELGMVISNRLPDLPSCHRLQKSSIDAVSRWLENEEDSISQAITGVTDGRLVLASLCRYRVWLENTTRRKFKRQQRRVAADLATWVASQVRRGGSSVFSSATSADCKDDFANHGLFEVAISFNEKMLAPAFESSLGKTKVKGRMAWEVDLPESMLHCEDARTASLLPRWDVNRGRMHIDYSGNETVLEIQAGKSTIVSGPIQTMIEIDGDAQEASAGWVTTCEYSDDEVHYLELEQPWTGGIVVQRQFLQIREDRSVMIADSVLPSQSLYSSDSYEVIDLPAHGIKHLLRLPTAQNVTITADESTREVTLDSQRPEVLVLPLDAGEWRASPSPASLRGTEDGHLVLSSTGNGCLFAPIWMDFQRRRFQRKRTWRQLTVADELRIVPRGEAVGYRIQFGSEQWIVYRSLHGRRPRTVMGKHFIVEFFCGRFNMGDGSIEDLVTVDDSEADES
ncbi:hypothetical protein [Stieleria varia]|uniref:Heparinase II/III-like protein n=1 Tax=Stieleria varia TaxID=2528005 RepID=A0A5C6BBA2_9BACT|nr:hypothetical protein [Stieleria varia]TWU08549.1 hypothetical protein Pla52n_11320 [Stieleria varia]